MTGLRRLRCASLPFYAVALLPVAIAACAKKPERQPRQLAMVSVVPAKRATVPYIIEANGIVTPVQTVSVTSQVDGIITDVDFQEGQEVQTGQALFHIDPRPYRNAYEQALAVLARDSATAANAKAEEARYRRLLQDKVVTPQEAAVQFTTAATTIATMRADQAAVANAKFNLENTVIRAPITGKTGSLLVRRGNLVRAGGAQPLVVINQVHPIDVRFAIPSSELPLLLQYGAHGGLEVAAVPGGIAAASPSIDSLAAAATTNPVQDRPGQGGADPAPGAGGGMRGAGAGARGMAADGMGSGGSSDGAGSAARGASRSGGGAPGGQSATPVMQQGAAVGERVMGRLKFIDNAVDTTTATVQLKASFDNKDGRLWAGQFASTSLHLFDEDSALVVPAPAVVTGQRGTYVYVVDQADTARQRAVSVERMAGGLAVITSGIAEGDRVVVDGQLRLTPDSPVRLRGAGDDAGGGARRGKGGGGKGRGRKGGSN